MIPPYGLEAKDFREYEETLRCELKNLAKGELANNKFVQLTGAAGKEVKAVDFQHRGKQVRYEIFEAMDAKSNKPYEHSLICTEVESALDIATRAPPSENLYQYTMVMTHRKFLAEEEELQELHKQGKGKKLKQLSKLEWWKNVHLEAGRYLWENMDNWSALEIEREANINDIDIKEALEKLEEEWINNKHADHTDHRYQKQRDLKASEHNGILRRTSRITIYWAVDPNGETLCFHHPTALVDAFGAEVVDKIYDDIKFFLSLHPPNLPDPQRHFDHERILKAHPEFAKKNGGSSGVVHYGCWHERGKEFAEAPLLLKTSDSRPAAATTEVFLNQLLRNACAHVTRVVALLFGIASPEMRDEYRLVVENVADYRRMDTVEEELWTLRAILNNVMTESHQDTNDWINGLVWNAPLGDNLKGTSSGAKPCTLPKLVNTLQAGTCASGSLAYVSHRRRVQSRVFWDEKPSTTLQSGRTLILEQKGEVGFPWSIQRTSLYAKRLCRISRSERRG